MSLYDKPGKIMRELEFRAWEKGKMWYFDFYDSDCFRMCDNIMQYTGIKDKNGKKIFDEDILRCDKWGIGQVVYHFPDGRNNIYGFVIRIGSNTLPMYIGFNKLKISHEIIGNVYENPELVKESMV